MTNEEKLSAVKAKIVEAVPKIKSINEVGCRILISTLSFTGTDFDGTIPADTKSECVVLSFDSGGFNGDDYDGETLKVWCTDWSQCRTWEDEIPEYEIIGRPITLEDVLKKLQDVPQIMDSLGLTVSGRLRFEELFMGRDEPLFAYWELGKPLDQQSHECIAFLHALICA